MLLCYYVWVGEGECEVGGRGGGEGGGEGEDEGEADIDLIHSACSKQDYLLYIAY